MRQGRGLVVCGLVVGLLATACGGSDDEAGSGDAVGEASAAAEAVLAVLDPGVDVADEPADLAGATFRAGEDGEGLAVRDVVRTDVSGFAEIAWFDGALARVDADSTYALVEFDATPGQAVVVTELDTGRVWNRLRTGVASTYEVRTDVATAAVRGTAFWVSCEEGRGCTFAVLEGEVAVRTSDGVELLLTAGQQVTVPEEGEPEAVTSVDTQDDWVVTNTSLDIDRGFAELDAVDNGDAVGAGDGGTEAAEQITCPLTAPDGWVEEGAPGVPQPDDRPCRFVLPDADEGSWALVQPDIVSPLDSPAERERFFGAGESQYELRLSATPACQEGMRETYTRIEDPVGSGELLGYWFRVMQTEDTSDGSGCLDLAGAASYRIVADGITFNLLIPYNTFGDDPVMDPGTYIVDTCNDSPLLSDANFQCNVAEFERLEREARDLAADLLGSSG